MRKNNIILLFVLLFAITASTCKKKYPKDIPRWLKEKIDKMEKESPRNGCLNDACRNVAEYTDGSSTFYIIQTAINPFHYTVYNYPGTLICEYDGAIFTDCNLKYDQLPKVRTIWVEN